MTTRPTSPAVNDTWEDPTGVIHVCVGVSPNRWQKRQPRFFGVDQTTPPTGAVKNDLWRNPNSGYLEVFNGSAWEPTSTHLTMYAEQETPPTDVPLGFKWREIPSGIERTLTSGGWFQ